LLDQGYRDLGHITGPIDWWEAKERKRGWHDTLRQSGFTIEDSQIVEGTWSAASGGRCLDQLLQQHSGMDAVFVSNDQMALGALQAARRNGLRVPQDLAIVGFDDLPESAYFYPPLTTVSQSLYDVGCASVSALHSLIEESRQENAELQPRTTILQPELIIRKSSVVD
jgi:LacI family transcriptional regulator